MNEGMIIFIGQLYNVGIHISHLTIKENKQFFKAFILKEKKNFPGER